MKLFKLLIFMSFLLINLSAIASAKVKVMIIDDAVDMKHPHIRATLDVATMNRIVSDHLTWIKLNEKFTKAEFVSHGTEVALEAIKGILSDIQLTAYPFLERWNTVENVDVDLLQILKYKNEKNLLLEKFKSGFKQVLSELSKGLNISNARVVNMSFSTNEMVEFNNLKLNLSFLSRIWNWSKLKKLAKEISKIYFDEFQIFIKAHQNVLFVIAAGNDGISLDSLEYELANVEADNVLVVGSASADGKIEQDSNYSETKVDLIAKTTQSSGGTSLSAARVTNRAIQLLIKNPELTVTELVENIRVMETTGSPSLSPFVRFFGVLKEYDFSLDGFDCEGSLRLIHEL